MKPQPSIDTPLTILLVEDNQTHARLVQRTLASHPGVKEIQHVWNGEEALQYLLDLEKRKPATTPRPNLILLDIRLPKMDGLELLQIIKKTESLKMIPVVILTTSRTSQDVSRAYQNHVNSYLVKPVEYDDFNQLMQEIGTYWLARNQQPATPGP